MLLPFLACVLRRQSEVPSNMVSLSPMPQSSSAPIHSILHPPLMVLDASVQICPPDLKEIKSDHR